MLEVIIGNGIINSNPNPTIICEGDGQIQYKNGHSLIWSRNKNSPRKGYLFDYYHTSALDSSKKVTTRLNNLEEYGEWIFVPVESGFYSRLTENGVIKTYPEIQLDIPSFRASELQILAALHEIGHAEFYNDVRDSVGKGRLLNLRGTFAEQLVQIDGLLSRILGINYEKISEFLAWENALLYDSRFFILNHVTKTKKAEFINKRLGSYLGLTKTIWTD